MRSDLQSFQRYWLMIATTVAALAGGVHGEEAGLSSAGDPYPLPTCVVLDSPLYDDSSILDFDGREIRVCCEDCVGEFNDKYDTWIRVVDERIVMQETPYYPLATCLVDGKSLDEVSTVDFVFRNRLFRLCSDDCRQAVEQHPGKYFGLLNEAVIKKQKPGYPSAACIVSGKPLGEDAVDHVVGNQLVRLAGKEQLDEFEKNPGKYLAELRKLAKDKSQQRDEVPSSVPE